MNKLFQMTEVYDGFMRIHELSSCSGKAKQSALRIFEEYQSSGVIRNESFLDSQWVLSDETQTCRFRFPADQDVYDRGAGTYTGLSLEDYCSAMKTFIISRMGSVALEVLHAGMHELLLLTEQSAEALLEGGAAAEGSRSFRPSPLSIQFLNFLPDSSGELSLICEELEDSIVWSPWHPKNRRVLAPFRTYLDFYRQLEDFWGSSSLTEKRSWFFIWLWWNLTCILPLRPTELLVTPWDCIRKKDGVYLMTVRRTKLKKRKGTLKYRVEHDYHTDTYEVPPSLARAVLWYQHVSLQPSSAPFTEAFPSDGIGEAPLSLPDNQERHPAYLFGGDEPLRYSAARELLMNFLTGILQWDNPQGIHLGDTRHLALISLIISGGSPEICQRLADHESVDISAHYYCNITSFIESAVYDFTRHSGKALALMPAALRIPPDDAELHPVPGGHCSAPEVLRGDISSCLENTQLDGHFADCFTCRHFYPDRRHQYQVVRQHREQAEADSLFLISVLNLARKEMGMEESIEAAMARAQTSSRKYFQALLRQEQHRSPSEKEEGTNGKASTV